MSAAYHSSICKWALCTCNVRFAFVGERFQWWRVLLLLFRYDHITPILKSLHWLPIRYRTEYKLLLLTFKALHHLAPSYLTDLLQLDHPTRTLRSSSDSLLTAHCARLRNYGDRAFCVAAPKLWNDLPLNMSGRSVNADLCTLLNDF